MTDVDLRAELSQLANVRAVSNIRTGHIVTHTNHQASNSTHARTADANKVHSAEIVWNCLGVVGLNHGL